MDRQSAEGKEQAESLFESGVSRMGIRRRRLLEGWFVTEIPRIYISPDNLHIDNELRAISLVELQVVACIGVSHLQLPMIIDPIYGAI